MPGSARVGKQRTRSSAKKRIQRSGSGAFTHQKAAHNHLLGQKSKRQKRLAGKTLKMSKSYDKMIKRAMPGS